MTEPTSGHEVGKLWGKSELLLRTPALELWRLEAVAGGYSSEHHHERKHNFIHVESGRLKVSILAPGAPRHCHLEAGRGLTIPPGVVHQFRAMEPTVAYEAYWTELPIEDIVRRTVGGVRTPAPPPTPP